MYPKQVIVPITSTLTFLSTLTIVLRLFTRFWIVRKPGWDDAAIVAALATNFVFFAFLMLEVHYHLGFRGTDISPSELKMQLKALWVTIPFYNVTLTLAKMSLTLLYIRLFAVANRRFRIFLLACLALLAFEGVWTFLSTILMCIPVRGFWDFSVPARCMSRAVIWYLNSGLQIVTDTVVVTTPIPTLARLHLPKRQKFALILVFALGFFACALSIIRLLALIELNSRTDFTRHNAPAATWSSIEANVTIICACLPPLQPLLSRICPRLFFPRVRARERGHDSTGQHTVEKNLRQSSPWNVENPFAMTSANYSASVTGNCSTIGDEVPETDGIQVVRELRWDLEHGQQGSDGS